ncbi:MAG: response regulator [Chloroflexi bacterium]|nr:response regulator [Chloroflexota bacterium]
MMVVDDDQDILSMVSAILSDEGYDVVTAEHGQAALAALAASEPQVILLDMNMPVMNGWEFTNAYRQMPGQQAPIVVFTASGMAERTAKEIGADGFVGKPFDLDELLEVLDRFVSP